MSLPQYPKYKNSGVAWLGDVPEHWEIKKIKRIVSMQSGNAITGEEINQEGTYPVYGGNGLRGYSEDITHSGEYLLIGRQGALCGNVHHVSGNFWASEHAVVCTFLANDAPRWTFYVLSHMNLGQYSVSAAQPGLAVERIQQLSTATPPVPEQTTIAAFLDRETAKIDALIAEQEKLITLLAEKRQATISHAVTKGLNPNAPMKNSGVAWLGDVPEHWEITPIKGMALLKGGAGFPDNEQGLEGEELGFYKVAALGKTDTYILLSAENTVSRDTAHRLGAFVFPERTIVFAKVGAALLLGRIKELPEAACIDNNMMGMVINQAKIDVSFLRYAMSLVRFDLIANPGAVPSVNAGQIGNFQLTNPPLAEQTTIAAFLDRETAKIDALTAEAKRGIGLLKERRAALISAAVTGKINVCNFVYKRNLI